MADTIILILSWLSRLSIGFPFVASIIIKDKIPSPLKIVRIYIIFSSLIQACITILFFIHKDNLFLFHIYITEAFVMLSLFYRELLKKTHPFKDKPIKRNIFLISIVFFILFAIINILFINGPKDFPTFPFLIYCVFMIVYVSWYDYIRSFYEPAPIINSELSVFKLYKGPVFWINKGILLYTSFSLLVAVLDNILYEEKLERIRSIVLAANSIFVIVLHIFMGIGFLKYKSNPADITDMEGKLTKQYNNLD